MKRALIVIGDFLLIMTAVSCTMGAVISAFSFTVDSVTLFLFWFCSAIVVSFSASFWRIKGLLILLLPALALLMWRLPEITEGARWAAHYLTGEFSQWLFLPVLFPGAAAAEYEQTLFFAFAGALLSLLLSVAISLRRSLYLTVVFTLPIVFLTFVAVYYPADQIFLFGLLAVYLTMLFSSSLYPDDFIRRGLAAFPALALALILMGISYVAASNEENYVHNAFAGGLRNEIRTFSARIGMVRTSSGSGWPVLSDGTWSYNTNNVDVSNAGRREITGQGLLEITSTHAGTFYLRGYSMMLFDGGRWTVNSGNPGNVQDYWAMGTPAYIASVYEELFPGAGLARASMRVVQTGDATRDVNYSPYFNFPVPWSPDPDSFLFYYPGSSIIELYSRLPPGEYRYDGYSGLYDLTDQISAIGHLFPGMREYSKSVHSRSAYLNIDFDTAAGLLRVAEDAGIDMSASREVIAEQVTEFFTSFGTYTLSPQIAHANEDFALYFLEVSQQGYCIHYATAATLMLRALGVPARFTTGFVASVSQSEIGQAVEVTDASAHAWVEVFYETYGWLPLEVTPFTGVFGAEGTSVTPGAGYSPPDQRGDEFDWDEPVWDGPGGSGRPSPPDRGDDYGSRGDGDGSGGDGGGDGDAGFAGQTPTQDLPDSFRLPLWFTITLAVIIVIVLRVVFSRIYRRLLFNQADTNLAIICAWRYSARLIRRYKWDPAPKAIEELALKARFSQHQMTEKERIKVVCFARKTSADIYAVLSLPAKLWARCVFGL